MNNKKFFAIIFGMFLILFSTLIFPTAFAGLTSESVELSFFIQENSPVIIGFSAAGDVEVPVVFGDGDTLTITFDKQTNRPTAATKAEIDNVFEFRQGGAPISLGDDYVGSWVSTSVFELRVVDSSNNDGPLIGQLTAKVKSGGNLLDISQTSDPSISESSVLTGNYGQLRGPVITSFSAEDLAPIITGYSNGDRLVLRFDVDTNGETLFGGPNLDREEVDQLLLFSQDLAGPEPIPFVPPGKYTAEWTSPKNLVITVNDVSGVTAPQVGVLTAQVKSSAGLQRELVASANSDAFSPLLQNSFGDPPAPTITSFLASDPDGGDAFYGIGDVFDIEFSEPTNGIALFGTTMDRTEIDSLLVFSEVLAGPTVPNAYTGEWLDQSNLQITVLDPTGNGSPKVDKPSMSIVGTRVTIQTSAGLQDEGLTTQIAGGQSGPLQGDFGQKAGPGISVFEVGDTLSIPLYSNGDTFTITFDEDTNRPIAATKTQIDKIFEFRQGVPIINLGNNYVGSWLSPSVFQIRIVDSTNNGGPIEEQISVSIKPGSNLRNAAGTSLVSDASIVGASGNFGLRVGPVITSLTAVDTGTIVPGHSDLDEITLRFDVNTNGFALFGTTMDRTEINSLLDFTQSIGDNFSGVWANAKTLRITILDATADATPQIGVLRAIVKQSANLMVDAPGGSQASSSISPPAIGNWGQRNGPFIVTVTAVDKFGQDGPTPIYGLNDFIIVEFSEETNQPFGPDLTSGELATLLSFSKSIGSNHDARWIDGKTLEIRILSSADADTDLINNPQSPTLTATVNAAANLRDDLNTTRPSISQSSNILGNFGTIAGPLISFLEIQDAAPLGTGLNDGDIITVTFDQATNEPDVSTRILFDAVFRVVGLADPPVLISDALGTSATAYSGEWFDPFTLIITILDATGADSNVDMGDFRLEVIGDLTNAERTSVASVSISDPPLGDFGLKAGPSIIALVADDPLGTQGFTDGDTISVIWSEKTNIATTFGTSLSKSQLDDIFTTTQSIGDDYDAIVTLSGDIVITIRESQELPEPPEEGQLQFIVKDSAAVQAASVVTENSITVSPVLTGSFGGYIQEFSLCSGGDAFATLPAGITTEISLPGAGCGGFTFEGAEETESDRIEFLGEPLLITPTGGADCSVSPFCDISFVFREEQIPEEGGVPVDPFTKIKILKDVDGLNGILQDFDGDGTITQSDLDASNEVFNGLPSLPGPPLPATAPNCQFGVDPVCTPDTIVIALNPEQTRFEASALTPSNSKFAIGGIKALALGAVAPSISTPSAPSAPSAPAGPSGSGGSGGNAASIDDEGLAGSLDLQQVKLFEATWDKCDEKILRVIAGPPGPGLSVKTVAAMGGISAMPEAEEQPFLRATIYELPISELETFIRVQVEAVIGREPSLAQRSLDLKECTGSVGGYSESEDFATPPLGVPAGAFPSTASLFEDGLMFETNYNDLDFGVGYWMPEGEITEMDVDEDEKAITFSLSEEMDGRFIISLPRGMISADDDQFILINPETSEPMEYDILESGVQYVTLEMMLPEGTDSVTVIGTAVVPEFGAVAVVVLVLSIACIIIISKTRPMSLVKL